MKIISIEGNIGSGKSTLIKKLRQLPEFQNGFTFLSEPVDEWNTIKDSDGITILEKYYSDQKKYAFSFQMMAYISRLKQLNDSKKSSIIITERCLYTDRNIFAKMLHDTGMIEEIEYSIYLKWFEYFIENLNDIKFIYVRSDPDVCSDRITLRNRKGENISIEYLSNCHHYHEKWLNNEKELLVLDGNENYQDDLPTHWVQSIKKFI
jgi:deoxyadenosine/deoxycytidine kinase